MQLNDCVQEVPDDQTLNDDMLLKNLDDKSIRSLNGEHLNYSELCPIDLLIWIFGVKLV